jgi:ABC-type transport system substrate-binding protein
MKQKNRIKLLYAFIILALAMLACEFSLSTAEISDVYMSRDENGTTPTTVFGNSDIFYCIVETAYAPSDTMVKVEWYAVDIDYEDIAPNTLLDSLESEGSDVYTFSLSNDYQWPNGLYRADIYLNGEFHSSVNFSVTE